MKRKFVKKLFDRCWYREDTPGRAFSMIVISSVVVLSGWDIIADCDGTQRHRSQKVHNATLGGDVPSPRLDSPSHLEMT